MKVLVTTAVLLIMLARVNSVPLELYHTDSKPSCTVNCFSPRSTTLSANKQGVPSESYLQEVREQLEERRQELEENQHQRETRSASDNTDNSTTLMNKPVRHGSMVALQALYQKQHWLGCSTTTTSCANSACPGLYIRGNEWNSCSQNVFQIFRAKGHGDVRVGDLVGLYLTRESGKWFGCSGTTCVKATCPGIASYEYGFNDPEKWYPCYGEVFKIYAHEKELGDTINDQDDIMLFYLQGWNWIGAYSSNHHRTCPGTTRPPPHNKYDVCGGENYKIWKK